MSFKTVRGIDINGSTLPAWYWSFPDSGADQKGKKGRKTGWLMEKSAKYDKNFIGDR
ncbi:MAG: hypothetical protein ACHQFX_04740 [Chitinophagales bacterium]